MVDYFGNRHNERFTFRRISWPEQIEGEELTQFSGGSIEKSALTAVKESGSANYEGEVVPNDNDLLRIYYSFTDDAGKTKEHVLATMSMICSEPTYEGMLISGTAQLNGLLQVLSNKEYGYPFTVVAGTKAVSFAKQLCEGLHLKVNASASSYTTSADHTFKAEDSYLTIVNWLLDSAGFASATTDPYGVVQMHPYVEPSKKQSQFTFIDDEKTSIMEPRLVYSNDWADTPNVVKLYFESEDESLWASASNIDPMVRSSTVRRNAEKTLTESVSELTGSSKAERLANLKNMALSKLIDNSSEIEYSEISHAWVPIDINDAIDINYQEAGITWGGSITNLTIKLERSAPCTMRARNYVTSSLKTLVEGGSF